MTYYEIGKATEVIINGSPLGLREILEQKESEEEGFKVITYISSVLTPMKKRYNSQIAPVLR